MKEWKLSRCENGHTVNQGSNHCVHCGEFCAPDDLGDEGLFNCEVLDKRFGTIQDLLAARTVKIKDQAKQIADLDKALMAKGAESVADSVKIWKLEARIKELEKCEDCNGSRRDPNDHEEFCRTCRGEY